MNGAQMVVFKPLNGYIPQLGDGEDILQRISPPYDVIDDRELENLKFNRFNVTRITLNPRNGRYHLAASELEEWISSGKLGRDEKPSFYLYRQSFLSDGKRLVRTGLVGILGLEPYVNGNVIPHEETTPMVKEDRYRLLEDTRTHSESIFGLYHHSDIPPEELLASSEPVFEVEDDDSVIHSFHRISDPAMVTRIERVMLWKSILIADGHHRYETALKYFQDHPGEKEGYVLATLVSSDDEGMVLLPTHRVLSELGLTDEELLKRMDGLLSVNGMDNFELLIKRVARKESMGFGLLSATGRMWYARLDETPDDGMLWAIDAYACQEIMFKKALGDRRFWIGYEESCRDAREKVDDGRADLAILLGSPTLEDIWRVAGDGIKMPKKSTFFYPKIWSGFIYYRMV